MDKEEQLQKLREEWKATADPVKRKIIESRARLLKMSGASQEKLIKTAKERGFWKK